MNAPLPFPRTFAELTPEWLTAALAGSEVLGDGRVLDVQVMETGLGMAVTSQVARLLLHTDGAPPGAPSSLIVKLPREHRLGLCHDYEREVRFYRALAPRGGFVPRCYLAQHDPDSDRMVMLLEDLSTARPGHDLEAWSVPQVRAVLDGLAHFQSLWWQSPELVELRWSRVAYGADAAARLAERVRGNWPALLRSPHYRVGPDLAAAMSQLLPRLADELVSLGGAPWTLVHNDMHTQNVLLDETGGAPRVTVIDWQDCEVGAAAHDVASAITRNLAPELFALNATDLLAHYLQALRALGIIGYPWEHLVRDWRRASLLLFLQNACWLLGYEPDSEVTRALLIADHERLARGVEHILRDSLSP